MSMVPGGFIILKRLSGGRRCSDVGRAAEIREPRLKVERGTILVFGGDLEA